jgi:methylmalonyl-CoA/ethylmalonyl-CoA epimerase
MFGLPLHHIGLASSDIEKAAEFVKRTFVIRSDTGTIFDELQNVRVRLFNEGEAGAIELVSGLPVARLAESGAALCHLCYATDDIEATFRRARESGALPVSVPKKAVLFDMRRVAFVYTPLGLVEFLEA